MVPILRRHRRAGGRKAALQPAAHEGVGAGREARGQAVECVGAFGDHDQAGIAALRFPAFGHVAAVFDQRIDGPAQKQRGWQAR